MQVAIFIVLSVFVVSLGDNSSKLGKRLQFKNDGTFKILHLSDVHYRIGPSQPSNDVEDWQMPYSLDGAKNTTDFIQRLIEIEQPDLVVHTGDIIDGATHPQPQGMDEIYGVTYGEGIEWAATLGNHDAQGNLTRFEVMDYILSLPKGLSKLNSLGEGETESYGNFYLEIFSDEKATEPSFRTFHLDATTNNVSINAAQVDWFSQTSSGLSNESKAPALAFFHIPLKEYEEVVRSKEGLCGDLNERVSYNGQSGLFNAILEEGSVKATFVGHDHTNNFCGMYKGVQLCYEGCPGYQGYMFCNHGGKCLKRMARVTEIQDFGESIRSWHRQAEDEYPNTSVIHAEILWSHDSSLEGLKRYKRKGDCERKVLTITDDEYKNLRSHRDAHYAAMKEYKDL